MIVSSSLPSRHLSTKAGQPQDEDWTIFGQLQQGLGFGTSKTSTFTVFTAPDLDSEDAALLEGAPPWVIAIILAPKPHNGTLAASLDVSPDGASQRVRISLTITPQDSGFEFDPAIRLWTWQPSGQLRASPFEFRNRRLLNRSRLYWTDGDVPGGTVWGASIDTPFNRGGLSPSGEIDLGFGS